IGGGIVDLIEKLLFAGSGGDGAAGARELGDDEAAGFVDFGERKAEPRQAGDRFQRRIGEIAAADLARAFEQMAGERASAEARPIVLPSTKGVDQRSQE